MEFTFSAGKGFWKEGRRKDSNLHTESFTGKVGGKPTCSVTTVGLSAGCLGSLVPTFFCFQQIKRATSGEPRRLLSPNGISNFKNKNHKPLTEVKGTVISSHGYSSNGSVPASPASGTNSSTNVLSSSTPCSSWGQTAQGGKCRESFISWSRILDQNHKKCCNSTLAQCLSYSWEEWRRYLVCWQGGGTCLYAHVTTGLEVPFYSASLFMPAQK